jgi:hypothetical protein
VSKTKPCTECWVEAQRREAVAGLRADDAYRQVLPFCPLLHDSTPLPPGAGDPFGGNR